MAAILSTETVHQTSGVARPAGSRGLWAGRVLSGLAVLFLGMDAAMKLVRAPQVLEGSEQLGFHASSMFGIGLTLMLCVVAYVIPRIAPLGAVLLTGYLGGAIATHVRVDNPLFSHVLFPVYVAAFVWGGLWLRDRRVRALLSNRAQG